MTKADTGAGAGGGSSFDAIVNKARTAMSKPERRAVALKRAVDQAARELANAETAVEAQQKRAAEIRGRLDQARADFQSAAAALLDEGGND